MCKKETLKTRSPTINRLRAVIRGDHKSIHTEDSYVHWVLEFIFWSNMQNPTRMGDAEVGAFLTYLAENNYSISSSRIALNALVYFYNRVIKQPLGKLNFSKSRKLVNIPDVLNQQEIASVLKHLSGDYLLACRLLYGTGMRLMECLQLRLKDMDFANNRIVIRDAKHGSDRIAPLPKSLVKELLAKVAAVKHQHMVDRSNGLGSVWLPDRIAEKYPKAEFSSEWQYLFPSKTICRDPRSGVRRRHHIFPTGLQTALKRAAAKAGITKRVSPHVFRHSFATHCLQAGSSITQVQKLLGHKDVTTTSIYLHAIDNAMQASPLDAL